MAQWTIDLGRGEVDALVAGDFQVAAAGWLLDYNDASYTLDLLRSGTAAPDGSLGWGNNYGRYSNARFDALMDRAAREFDLAERGKLLHEAERLAMDEFATIPIYWYVSKNAVSPKVSGFTDNVENIHRVRWMSKSKAP